MGFDRIDVLERLQSVSILDATGHVYVSGYSDGPLDGGFEGNRSLQDVILFKLDPTGKQLWLRQVGGIGNDYARSVAVDAAGNAYAVGYTSGGLTNTSDVLKRQRYLVVKFNTNGTELWRKELGEKASNGKHGDDFAEAANLDANGMLYVSGFTTSSTFDAASPTEAFIAKINANGEVIWTKRFGEPNGSSVDNIAVDAQGHSFVAGNTYSTQTEPGAVFVTKYDTAGSRVWWSRREQVNSELVYDLALGSNGQVFITGV